MISHFPIISTNFDPWGLWHALSFSPRFPLHSGKARARGTHLARKSDFFGHAFAAKNDRPQKRAGIYSPASIVAVAVFENHVNFHVPICFHNFNGFRSWRGLSFSSNVSLHFDKAGV